ncbi:hypothetical protein CAC42_2726 [Sphaceloma murrayae]|uniref:Uncharacterized protein n=1 Tax=Sphaceloma murrayae TaxID=2082308 RepID=A0A2K1R0G6_9PEZI|nr:hypothetical protein CAC42_2726 [Sphaceloma murrayae]
MSATDVQALLRFLTKDAKLPLATAMGKVKELQAGDMGTVESISRAKLDQVKAVFTDEKISKSIHNAAKRINKKRAAGEDTTKSPAKKPRKDPFEVQESRPPSEVERELELSMSNASLEELEKMVFITNRAPLVLAFAVTIVRYTMPEQPPSSRLSLAQAVVSLGSQSKAKYIGLQTGPTAEDEGWNEGQPKVTVMGREISVLKRWGYEWAGQTVREADGVTEAPLSAKVAKSEVDVKAEDDEDTTEAKLTIQKEAARTTVHNSELPALWAIDLEQLKNLNGPLTFPASATSSTAGLPVYDPHSARAYMYRSFDSMSIDDSIDKKPGKKTAASAAAHREANVGCLLTALDMLYESWAGTLDRKELDKRSWSC